jgi:hypothetical protein
MRLPEAPETPSNKRRKTFNTAIDGSSMEVDDDEEVKDVQLEGLPGKIRLTNVVVVAKPAPFHPEVNFGPASSVPNEPGIVFPYFFQMISPDYQIINEIVFRYFLRNLGDTKENFIAGYKRFETATKTWMDSPEGMVFQHIFYGIDLALSTQSRLFLVAEHGQYCGFVLLGMGFTVVAQDLRFEPVSAEDLRDEVAKMSPHDLALDELSKLFSEATIGTTKKRVKVSKENLKSYRSIYNQYHKRSFDSEEKDRIDSLISDLSFPERFWTVSPNTIDLFLGIYANRDGQHADDAPMYIGSGLVREDSANYLALSVFGSTAPSFFTVGGEKKAIPAPGKPDPLSVIDPATKKPTLPVIPYTMKGIRTSMDDLYKVWKDRAIFVLPRERAGPSRTTQFQGAARNQVWESLKTHIGGREIDESVDKKKVPTTADKKDTKGKGKSIAFGMDDDSAFD